MTDAYRGDRVSDSPITSYSNTEQRIGEKMTQEQIDFIMSLDPTTLDAVKDILAKRENELWAERWWTHTTNDNYLYAVHYADGQRFLTNHGADAYKEYNRNPSATWLERYTKDLFPVHETLLRKEMS